MFHHARRLCSTALALFGPSVLAAAPSSEALTDPQVRFMDADLNPLPADFITVRASDGRIIVPNVQNSSFVFRDVGRKITLEFTPKGLKQRSVDLGLENAPRVWLTMIVNPETGQ